MANVVITHFSGIISSSQFQSSNYYDGLVSALQEQGNNVLQVITSDFLARPWGGSNETYSKGLQQHLISQIQKFKPDLIISFNNSSIRNLEKEVSCPIILWDADSFEFFNDKDEIIKNQDRYHYFAYSQKGLDDYNKYITSSNAIKLRVPSATHIKREDLDKKYNISFIGNAFLNSPALCSFLNDHPEYVDISLQRFSKLSKEEKDYIKGYIGLPELKYQSTSISRVRAILFLLDHGIKIFGSADWLALGNVDSRIFRAYDPSLVFSAEHNALVYNRSRIALNVSHQQNITGYPWRVLDIMASSSAVMTDFKSDLVADFPEVKFVIYNSIAELVEQTKKLLDDKERREDYILECNAAIDKNFRWSNRFNTISEVTGVNLKAKAQLGKHTRLMDSEHIMDKIAESLPGWLFIKRRPTQTPKHLLRVRKKIRDLVATITPPQIKRLRTKMHLLRHEDKKLYE